MPIGVKRQTLRTGSLSRGNPCGFATHRRSQRESCQRVRDRVPRNCGMLQAKAMHLFFSEAMTEGTAGKWAVNTPSAWQHDERRHQHRRSPRNQQLHAVRNLSSSVYTVYRGYQRESSAPRTSRAAPLEEPTNAGLIHRAFAVPLRDRERAR
jgi:hypothetical protein